MSDQDPYVLLQNLAYEQINDNDRTAVPGVVLYDITYDTKQATIVQLLNQNNVVLETFWGLHNVNTIKSDYTTKEICVKLNQQSPIYSSIVSDGQLVKIGYAEQIDAWLICVNNLTIAAKQLDDLEHYTASKYNLHYAAGKLWFKYIKQQSDQLKSELNGRTLHGTLVGYPGSYIRYSDVELLFNGILGYNTKTVYELFTHYKLPFPKTSLVNPQYIDKHLQWALSNDTELVQAGIIIHQDNESYLLNNLEYLIFKAIQTELLSTEKNRKQLAKQIKDICTTNRLPRPQEYYLVIFDTGKKYVEQYNKANELCRDDFSTFVSIILSNQQNNKQFNTQQLKDIDAFLAIPWNTYQPQQLTRIPVYVPEVHRPVVHVVLFVGLAGMGISNLINYWNSLINIKLVTSAQLVDIDVSKYNNNDILIVDKAFNPNEINSILNSLNEKVNRVVIHPITGTFSEQGYMLPFSLEFMLTCLKRSCKTIDQLAINMTALPPFEKLDYQILDSEIRVPFLFFKEQQLEFDQDNVNNFLDVFDHSSENKKCTNKKFLNTLLRLMSKVEEQPLDTFEVEAKYVLLQIFPFLDKEIKQSKGKVVQKVKQQEQPIVAVDIRKESEDQRKNKPKKQVEKKQVYDPLYLPNQLSIVFKNKYNAKDKANKWIRECLLQAQGHFENDKELDEIARHFKNQTLDLSEDWYQLEKDFYLQLLKVDTQDQGVRDLPYFREFQPDRQCQVNLKVLVISLDGMITGLVADSPLLCQNPFPHVNLYSRSLKSRDSTDFIASTINSDQKLKQAYRDGSLMKTGQQNQFYKVSIKIKGKQQTVYLISLKDAIQLDGESSDRN